MASVHISTLFDTPPKARMSAEDYIASPQSANKSDLIEGVLRVSLRTGDCALARVDLIEA